MFTWSNDVTEHKVVKICNVRPNWYVAIESTIPAEGTCFPYIPETLPSGRKRYVFACVVLTRRSKNEWGHKEIEEGSGPNECNAPLSFLNVLSPLAPFTGQTEWMYNWRRNCREMATRRAKIAALKPGMILKSPEKLSFGAYGTCQRFEVITPRRFKALDMGGMTVTLRPSTLLSCEIQ